MSLITCNKCERQFNGSRALKEHMSAEHGGFTADDIPNNSGGQARSILGDGSNLADLVSRAPTDDSAAPNPETKKGGRPRKDAEEKERQQRRLKAMQTIGKQICKRTASLPYTVWSRLSNDPDLRLSEKEREELTAAYLEICQGYDCDFSSPFFGVLAALSINAEFIAARLGIDLTGDEEPTDAA